MAGSAAVLSGLTTWDPSATRFFQFSICNYPDGVAWADRKDTALASTLAQRGVPPAATVQLLDGAATLAAVVEQLKGHLSACTNPEELLIVYFGGHGSNTGGGLSLCVYDHSTAGTLPAAELFALLERHYTGARVLLLADCCYSGMLALEAPRRAGRLQYAVLASQMAAQTSTGLWTFTNALIEGFSGELQVDTDGNGMLLLKELAEWLEARLAAEAGQLSMYAVVNGFPDALVLARTQPHVPAPLPACRGAPSYPPGAAVRVLVGRGSSQALVPGTVLACRRGLHFVRPEGGGAMGMNDLWVAPAHLQGAACGGSAEPRFEVGQRVEALYVGGHDLRYSASVTGWWLADVAAAAPAWHVAFDDGAHEVVMQGWVRSMGGSSCGSGLAPGQPCEAVWKQGKDPKYPHLCTTEKFFPGRVVEAYSRTYSLKFSDGAELFGVPAANMRAV
jgi:hypothetical protein